MSARASSLLNGYEEAHPPVVLSEGGLARTVSKDEAREYGRWYHAVADERIRQLCRCVTSTPGFENWAADGSPESLVPLGQWFEQVIESRPFTREEIAAMGIFAPTRPAERFTLTSRTRSVALDIGIYLGRVFIAAVPGARWTQELRALRSVDYGYSLIKGRGRLMVNPTRLVEVLGSSLMHGSARGEELRHYFEVNLEYLIR